MLVGAIADAIGTAIGGLIGLFVGKLIPDRITESITVALCMLTVVLAADGILDGSNIMITMISLVLGVVIGEILRLDDRVNNFGDMIQAKIDSRSSSNSEDNGKPKFSEGFIITTLFLCVGAMTIMATINAGTKGDNSMFYMKALADTVVALTFATTKGAGVPAAAVSVLIVEGGLTLCASAVAPYIQTALGDINCVGSLMLFGMTTNMIGLTNIRLVNFTPGLLLPVLLCQIM